ncbi:MAG: DUF1848 domain-containing protein [Marinilabiliaceae bacterium]|nr:DUF1848 domain-containing protein [Marinilabiliaceae bacterium]
MHNKIQITTDSGTQVEAQAPVIISASRSTDIPAFYAKWFINRLKAGYSVWHNNFNGTQMYVSFKNTKVVVFWSKNPKPIMPLLKELDDRGIHYYFQFTLNDYDREGFEPNVPPLSERIETFKALSEQIGKEKVIWRFDPLIVTPALTPIELLKKIWYIGNQLRGYTNKFVFSFIDINAYEKVQRNMIKESPVFDKETIENSEFTTGQMFEIADGLMKIRKRWEREGWEISIASCAEQEDFKRFDIEHNRCIDGELMKQIFAHDKDLVYYLNYGKLPENNLLSLPINDETNLIPLPIEKLKDKGQQRKTCGCTISKDIGMYNTCSHFCIYCYANNSKETVLKNRKSFTEKSESIIN